MTITTNIKAIRDIMRKDTGVDGDAQRISQMVWMLFNPTWAYRFVTFCFSADKSMWVRFIGDNGFS